MGYVIGDVPTRELYIRTCIDDKVMYVSKPALKHWCKTKERTNGRGYSWTALVDQLQRSGRLLDESPGCIALGGGTSVGPVNGQCIMVKLDGYDE
jgi:hypothetical protein